MGGDAVVQGVQETAGGLSLRAPVLATSFSGRRNSLNFLRLVLALIVVVSHVNLIGGFAGGSLGQETVGMIAVYGFFGISGFLIAGSASRNSPGRYLWQRFLRIMPGFWVCLVITAFVFGAIGWHFQHPRGPHSGLVGYLEIPAGPFGFVFHNFWLEMNQNAIGLTPRGVPQPLSWNGSLWTLVYEFICYLILGGLAIVGLLRRRHIVALLALGAWLVEAAITLDVKFTNRFTFYFHALINISLIKLLTFGVIFLVGALLYLYRSIVPDSALLAVGCTAVFAESVLIPVGGHYGVFTMSGMDLAAPFLAYPLLWLGIHLPLQRVGARNDYSYGIYIYAYPLQQLLAIWHVERWGYLAFSALSVLGTIPLAVASWWLVERHALKLKAIEPGTALLRLFRRPADGGLAPAGSSEPPTIGAPRS